MSEVDALAAVDGDDDAFTMRETHLATEKSARRDTDARAQRRWKLTSATAKNFPASRPAISFRLDSPALLDPDSPARKRAAFVDHQLWITRFEERALRGRALSQPGPRARRVAATASATRSSPVKTWSRGTPCDARAKA